MRRDKSKEWLKAHPILYPKQFDIKSPFELLNLTHQTDIQQMVQKYAKVFKYYCTFAFSASCGAGKTLAGIYLMHYFGVKTLIVSSRSAINDQWEAILKSLYPELKIKTIHNKKLENPDVYIYSPQYLVQDLNKMPSDVNFIIYDEIHSIVSDKFGTCVEEPMKWIQKRIRRTMPYMLALSGTYPKQSTIIRKIFGEHIPTKSSITDIPVYVYDYHVEAVNEIIKDLRHIFSDEGHKCRSKTALDVYTKTKDIKLPIKDLSMLENKTLIGIDERYKPLDDYEFIDYILPKMTSVYGIDLTPKFRGFVITNTIDSSVYAAVKIANMFNVNVLLMRAVGEPSYIIKPGYESIEASAIRETQELLGNEDDIVDETSRVHRKDKVFRALSFNDGVDSSAGDDSEDTTSEQSFELDLDDSDEGCFSTKVKTSSAPKSASKNKSKSNTKPISKNNTPQNGVEEQDIEGERQKYTQAYLPTHYAKVNTSNIPLIKILDDNNISVVCGCIARLKEGISVENAVWGICTKFIYSTIARTQILGRVRRTSKNPEISNHKRIFIVNSSDANTNQHMLMASARKLHKQFNPAMVKTLYDFDYEAEVFARENYVYAVVDDKGEDIDLDSSADDNVSD